VNNPADSDPQSTPNNGNTVTTTDIKNIPQFKQPW
jgi:hypothetical protein